MDFHVVPPVKKWLTKVGGSWGYHWSRSTSVTSGWKWHLVRDKNHFIFFTPVTENKYSFYNCFLQKHNDVALKQKDVVVKESP